MKHLQRGAAGSDAICSGTKMGIQLSATPLPVVSLNRIKETISANLRSTLQGDQEMAEIFSGPQGDPGYFGPGSVTWQVHGDLPSMLVGGIASLLLQSLHPLAMAGVADHSNYREDPLGRLQRTALFVGTTSFGSTQAADRAIEMVKVIHSRVVGVGPTGEPYQANDPDLLTWVHVAETACFLRAYRRFGDRYLPRSAWDKYFLEMSTVATKLGAREVPQTFQEVREYFGRVRPSLALTNQSRDGISYIVNTTNSTGVEEALRALIVQAAIGILPGWARDLGQIRQPGSVEGVGVDMAMRSFGGVLRWALGESEVLRLATQRVTGPGVTQAA